MLTSFEFNTGELAWLYSIGLLETYLFRALESKQEPITSIEMIQYLKYENVMGTVGWRKGWK